MGTGGNATLKRVIVDFDNTMGIPGCDVDDGLALLFLLGCPEQIEVIAATTTYGNNLTGTVYMNTRRLFAGWNLDLPVFRGCPDARHPESEASRFLARAAADAPGEISVLALGSLTNLRGARGIDPAFFGNVREVVAMGGITRTLVFNGVIMNELNFACDPIATRLVLSESSTASVATSNNCLEAYFTAAGLEERFGHAEAGSLGEALWRDCGLWLADVRERYGLDGFHCWDVVAAANVAMPELFEDDVHPVTMSEALLGVGYLEEAFPGAPRADVNMPIIKDGEVFIETVCSAWERGLARLQAGTA
jgi:inosine-uridine nucleoside N-ribohydrolase